MTLYFVQVNSRYRLYISGSTQIGLLPKHRPRRLDQISYGKPVEIFGSKVYCLIALPVGQAAQRSVVVLHVASAILVRASHIGCSRDLTDVLPFSVILAETICKK